MRIQFAVGRLRAAVAACLVAALSACGGGQPDATTPPADTATSVGQGSVEGTVIESRDAAPVAHASVSVGDRTATTDDEGRFRLDGLGAGTKSSG